MTYLGTHVWMYIYQGRCAYIFTYSVHVMSNLKTDSKLNRTKFEREKEREMYFNAKTVFPFLNDRDT